MKTRKAASNAASALILLFLGANLTGCSAKQTYGGLQQGARNDCNTSVNSTEYAQCMERVDMSYEEYEQARKEGETSRDSNRP